MRNLLKNLALVLFPVLALSFAACGNEEEEKPQNNNEQKAGEHTGMSGNVADLEYSIVTIKKLDGTKIEVDLNGLAVEEMNGGEKNDAGEFQVVKRRGVRFDKIFEKGNITAADIQPVTFVCRDGYDAYRTKLKNDATKLPEFKWLLEKGYILLDR